MSLRSFRSKTQPSTHSSLNPRALLSISMTRCNAMRQSPLAGCAPHRIPPPPEHRGHMEPYHQCQKTVRESPAPAAAQQTAAALRVNRRRGVGGGGGGAAVSTYGGSAEGCSHVRLQVSCLSLCAGSACRFRAPPLCGGPSCPSLRSTTASQSRPGSCLRPLSSGSQSHRTWCGLADINRQSRNERVCAISSSPLFL